MSRVDFNIEDDVRLNAELALKEMGLSMSTAVNIFLIKVGREKRIPFEINVDPFYDPEHIAELERRFTDAKAGRNMHEHELIEDDDE